MCPWMQPALFADVSAVHIAAVVVGAVPTHRKILLKEKAASTTIPCRSSPFIQQLIMFPQMQPALSVDVSVVHTAAVVGAEPTHRKI